MKTFLRVLTISFAAATPALANTTPSAGAEGADGLPGSFLLQTIALLVLIACTMAATRFYTSIRGGRVGRGWLWILWGFTVFSVSQLLVFTAHLEVLSVPSLWIDALRVTSLLLFFLGINQMRKVLA